MKIGIIKEKTEHETRVALSPETAKAFTGLGCEVLLEKDAGTAAGFSNDSYQGATLQSDPTAILKEADIILKVQAPTPAELAALKPGSILIGMFSNATLKTDIITYAKQNISTFSMEFLPRISRAQAMDVLSSQSNLSGYKAVIDAVSLLGKVVPMMTTAAGSIKPAKVLVLGAGVAGLQAIATAKRLGAVVSAFDVRPDAKEQVQSLGARFIEVEQTDKTAAETKGGYAKEMSEDYKKKQSALIHETLKTQDIAICTALIPGRPAPTLITETMVKDMQPGSIIVDLAAVMGGNCQLTQKGKVSTAYGTTIIGYENFPSRLAYDASRLYAKNLLNFVTLLIDPATKQLHINLDDELIKNTLLTHQGKITHPLFQEVKA
jgi:H+-translocating NAD(P) transhydrogenase subunit alpha